MKRIELRDVIYACTVHQQDDTLPYLLMLHGFMGDQRVFFHLTDKLCTFCNPVTVDLLGYGQSSKPTDPKRYNEQQQINDICSLVTVMDINPCFLFGYSMGGRLALKTVLEKPTCFRGLVLESTTCGITDAQQRKERQQLDAQWGREIREDFETFLSEWEKLDLFKGPSPSDESLVQTYRKIQSEQSPAAHCASLRGFGTGSMSPVCNRLERCSLPVLLLAGSADDKYQRINQYLVDQLPNATFSSSKAGHRTHLDNPTAFVRSIKRYMKENAPH